MDYVYLYIVAEASIYIMSFPVNHNSSSGLTLMGLNLKRLRVGKYCQVRLRAKFISSCTYRE